MLPDDAVTDWMLAFKVLVAETLLLSTCSWLAVTGAAEVPPKLVNHWLVTKADWVAPEIPPRSGPTLYWPLTKARPAS